MVLLFMRGTRHLPWISEEATLFLATIDNPEAGHPAGGAIEDVEEAPLAPQPSTAQATAVALQAAASDSSPSSPLRYCSVLSVYPSRQASTRADVSADRAPQVTAWSAQRPRGVPGRRGVLSGDRSIAAGF